MKPEPTSGEWLATMRTAWKAGKARDERQECAASAKRLARVVQPEKEAPARQTLRDFLPVALCLAACALGGMGLRHTMTMTTPRTSAIREIRADEAREIAPAATASAEPPAVATAASSASAASTTRLAPTPAPPAKAKSETEALPPLPRPTPSNDRADDDRRKTRRFELRIDRAWRKLAPPAPMPTSPSTKHPRRLPPGHVRDL